MRGMLLLCCQSRHFAAPVAKAKHTHNRFLLPDHRCWKAGAPAAARCRSSQAQGCWLDQGVSAPPHAHQARQGSDTRVERGVRSYIVCVAKFAMERGVGFASRGSNATREHYKSHPALDRNATTPRPEAPGRHPEALARLETCRPKASVRRSKTPGRRAEGPSTLVRKPKVRRPESPGRCPEASARRAPEDQGADQSPHDAAEECQGAPRDAARRPQDACQKASGRRPNAPGRGPEAPRRNPKTSRRFSRLGARRSTATRPTSRRACGKATCTRYVSTPHEYHDEKHREPINNPVGWRAFQTTGEMRSTRARRMTRMTCSTDTGPPSCP